MTFHQDTRLILYVLHEIANAALVDEDELTADVCVSMFVTDHLRALDTAVTTGAGSLLSAQLSPCGTVQVAVDADRAYALTIALPERNAEAVAAAVRTAYASAPYSLRADVVSPTELRIALVGTRVASALERLDPLWGAGSRRSSRAHGTGRPSRYES